MKFSDERWCLPSAFLTLSSAEVKLSSLSYALLPSTKIEIFSLDFRASLKVILVLSPQRPFVSEVQVSMSSQPHCDFRARPVSNER
jgi:Ca2+-dependent lipid-binding protein